ncbi:hypothetical protein DPMN_029176 [Dreissena polymorpha]|uniref:Uncharacterized protein n=1 Tax=Dreissena polymorpha TaxID=45954 RepID=A0A9D4LVZ8_DREPO|nr:hypothetical protein DPMN_029176 [Dreissena polymorpha]
MNVCRIIFIRIHSIFAMNKIDAVLGFNGRISRRERVLRRDLVCSAKALFRGYWCLNRGHTKVIARNKVFRSVIEAFQVVFKRMSGAYQMGEGQLGCGSQEIGFSTPSTTILDFEISDMLTFS